MHIQHVELLFQLPQLAAQTSSKLLAEMLSLCTRGQENSACLFQLPATQQAAQ
jgi:hypothetical protein